MSVYGLNVHPSDDYWLIFLTEYTWDQLDKIIFSRPTGFPVMKSDMSTLINWGIKSVKIDSRDRHVTFLLFFGNGSLVTTWGIVRVTLCTHHVTGKNVTKLDVIGHAILGHVNWHFNSRIFSYPIFFFGKIKEKSTFNVIPENWNIVIEYYYNNIVPKSVNLRSSLT